jgi:SRSO17 transposase
VALIWRRGSKGRQRGRLLRVRGRPAGVTHAGWHERPAGSCRCVGCWPNGPRASLSRPSTGWRTCPETTPLERLVHLAKLRWRVEQDDRELKDALGLDHVEGRGFGGWHHHVTLVSVAHGFPTLERLRSPNLVASA